MVESLGREFARAQAESRRETEALRAAIEAQRLSMEAQIAQLFNVVANLTAKPPQASGGAAVDVPSTASQGAQAGQQAPAPERNEGLKQADVATPPAMEDMRTPVGSWAEAAEESEEDVSLTEKEDGGPMDTNSAVRRVQSETTAQQYTVERRAKKGRTSAAETTVNSGRRSRNRS